MKFKSQNFCPFHALILCNKGSLKLVGMKEHSELELDIAVGKIKAIFFPYTVYIQIIAVP